MAKLSELLSNITINGITPDVVIDQVGGDADLGDINIDAIASSINNAHRDQLSGIMKNHNAELAKKKDEAYKAAERKVRTDVETTIVELFGITDEFEGVTDLINKVHSNYKPAQSAGENKTPQELKELELKYKKEIQALKDEKESEINKMLSDFQREKTIGHVNTTALSALESLNPVYTGNQTVDQNIKSTFLDKLSKYEYKKSDDGFEIYDGENLLSDDKGNKVSLEDHIKNVASGYFTFKGSLQTEAPIQTPMATPVMAK